MIHGRRGTAPGAGELKQLCADARRLAALCERLEPMVDLGQGASRELPRGGDHSIEQHHHHHHHMSDGAWILPE